MNKPEALKILGLNSSASEDDIKKRFRKLAFDKHPDRNKSENAEEEYKKISEAFEYLKNPPPEPESKVRDWRGFVNINDVWAHHVHRPRKPTPPDIYASVRISFKESVLGCTKKIKINRTVQCKECLGDGEVPEGEGCSRCNNRGTITSTHRSVGGSVTVQIPCPDCNGKGAPTKECESCLGAGGKSGSSEFDVSISGGIVNGQKMRLTGAGNFYKSIIPSASDVYLTVFVESVTNMSISGKNVISTIDISLYDAIKGATKTVKTIEGKKDIEVKPGSKHKDEVRLEKYGVRKKGDHIFTLNVIYPKDTSKIIEALKPEDK